MYHMFGPSWHPIHHIYFFSTPAGESLVWLWDDRCHGPGQPSQTLDQCFPAASL